MVYVSAIMKTRENGYGYLNGCDGTIAGLSGNFDDYLACQIRAAQMSMAQFPEGYHGQVIKVYSVDNTCSSVCYGTHRVPNNAIIHWSSDGKRWPSYRTQMQDLLSMYEEEKLNGLCSCYNENSRKRTY